MSKNTLKSNFASASVACDFCDEFAGGLRNAFAKLYGDLIQARTLVATKEFRVIPSLGQIVEGYLLVVPAKHYATLADMPPELSKELAALIDRVRETLSSTYGPCIFFEHGARSGNAGGCGIYHAHLHAVPLSEGKEPITLLRERFCNRRLESVEELSKQAKAGASYLYYEDSHSNGYIFDTEYLPSQYMRKLVAQAVRNDQWDWRKCGREEALLSTIARLAQAFCTSATPSSETPPG